MVYPSEEEITESLKDFDVAPVFCEVLKDSTTPIMIFNALLQKYKTCCMLESVSNQNQWGRYSFIGINPKKRISVNKENISSIKNLKDYIKEQTQNIKAFSKPEYPNFTGGFIGYFGYDCASFIEPKIPNTKENDLEMNDIDLFLYDEIIAFDHLKNKVLIINNIYKNKNISNQYNSFLQNVKEIKGILQNLSFSIKSEIKNEMLIKENISKSDFMLGVEKVKEYILDGEIFQVVLSRRIEIENPPDSFNVYRKMRSENPSPYLFYITNDEYSIAGSSPEMLVKVQNGIVTTKPIAGTVVRGKDLKEDEENCQKLLKDEKECCEHTMLVDLGRNDIGKVCDFGSVKVTDFMQTEKYSKVIHLVSTVSGTIKNDKDCVDCLFACLPAGTLSGAPKVRAMEIIDEIEKAKRGVYGGAVGYMGFDGNMDMCIAIRSIVFAKNKAFVQAGAGIVADSVSEKEFEETENKAFAMLNALKSLGD